MAAVIKSDERNFQENSGRIDPFRLLTDVSRSNKGINPENLNFDIRQLNPGEYCSAYHFHRYAEELFVIMSGSATLRTPNGLEVVGAGDLAFFEKGETGTHQLYNHTEEPCIYLDIRTFIGYDVCEYPDSNKIYLIPSGEIFNKDNQMGYFDGEENIKGKWEEIKNNEK